VIGEIIILDMTHLDQLLQVWAIMGCIRDQALDSIKNYNEDPTVRYDTTSWRAAASSSEAKAFGGQRCHCGSV
jgi:hypothetical protein